MNKREIQEADECMRKACFRLREADAVQRERSAADELLAHYGRIVGDAARREFPGGVLVSTPTLAEALCETRRLIAAETTTMFEAAFSHLGVNMRADVLRRRDGNEWELIEVKAGLSPDDHFEDVAVQKWVLNGLGMQVCPFLMLLDSAATLESPSLFRLVDCRKEVEVLMPIINERIGVIRKACESDRRPNVPFTRKCRDCDWLRRCLPDLPTHNPLTLYRGGSRIDRLLAMAITSLDRVPAGFRLSDVQQRQVDCIRSGRAWVSLDLKQRLAEARYPLFFTDFEALAHPIPQFRGQHCYHLTPFQWSCHIQRSPEQAPEHLDFLADRPGDPRLAFAKALLRCVGSSGSIVVYTQYEGTIIKSLASDLPELSAPLLALLTRLFDLHAVVKNGLYHSAFQGSFSIKNVLPALVHGFSYGDLPIRDGLAAVWAYIKMTGDTASDAERQQIAADLRRYCQRDSMAMLLVYEALLRLTA